MKTTGSLRRVELDGGAGSLCDSTTNSVTEYGL